MQQANLLKKIAIVDNALGFFKIDEGKLGKETLKEQVQCFKKAADLLQYLKQLKKDRMLEEFPDYVLIDIHLPDMEADVFLDDLEQLIGATDASEVFILSSSASKQNRDLAMQYPFVSAYLEKPVSADFLEVLIGVKSVDNPPH